MGAPGQSCTEVCQESGWGCTDGVTGSLANTILFFESSPTAFDDTVSALGYECNGVVTDSSTSSPRICTSSDCTQQDQCIQYDSLVPSS
eukprot:CAMPEP_0197456530 /NCGR_PEP_ID=MMETSP1175-20131217/43637_1 /TAXON_ID=1003142 /ORGANISM="Triceratium dubium, Strain CCMP147" /LENGTH=88 /DNA_ID=CAMNT_0042990633 /DNA_START=60 /DNA_END=322 /DNA_ORIENTATION=+